MTKIFPIVLDEELNKKIDEYMLKHEYRTKRDCIIDLIKKGLGIKK